MNVVKSCWLTVVAVVMGLQLFACRGDVGSGNGGGGGGGGGGSGSNGNGGAGGGAMGPAPPPQSVPIRRLTNAEYLASVTDLFPGVQIPAVLFEDDLRVLNFVNFSSSQTSSRLRMEQYEGAAQKVADAATANPTTLTGCDAVAQGEQACTQPYLYGLAKRAYRRPLTEAEKTALWQLFMSPDGGDYRSRLGMAIAGVLLSPNFLFRPELGDPGRAVASGIVELTPWELAARLSYFVNGSLPDAALTAAADTSALRSTTELRAQAQRLLGLTRSQAQLVKFHELWLRVDRVNALSRMNAAAYPDFNTSLAVAMGQETRLFIQNVMFTQQGTFRDLLRADYTFGNAQLATLYGAPRPATDWGRIQLDANRRSGLLTQASLLASLAKEVGDDGGTPIGTPVIRGKFVLEQLLCRTVSPPSPEIVAMFPPQDTTLTARAASEAHRVSAVCAVCHASLDPLGLPFEHYDAMGKWRDTDRGMQIDASGNLDGVAFDGVPALAELVAQRNETRSCYVTQWFRFANGRLNGNLDQPYIDWLSSGFTSDKKLVDLVVDIVLADGFRQLRVDPTAGSGI